MLIPKRPREEVGSHQGKDKQKGEENNATKEVLYLLVELTISGSSVKLKARWEGLGYLLSRLLGTYRGRSGVKDIEAIPPLACLASHITFYGNATLECSTSQHSSLEFKLANKNMRQLLGLCWDQLWQIYFLPGNRLKHFYPYDEIGYSDLLQISKHYEIVALP